MVTFNLIEGEDRFDELYDNFKKDYLNKKFHASSIKKKYDLTNGLYNRLSKAVREEEGIQTKKKKIKKLNNKKNIYHRKGLYIYIKQIKGKTTTLTSSTLDGLKYKAKLKGIELNKERLKELEKEKEE